MQMLSTRSRYLLGLALAVTACADMDDAPLEHTREAASELAVSSWANVSGTSLDESYRGAAVASIGGVTYAVRSGRCGAWSCWSDGEANELYWQKLTTTGWSAGKRISSQSANSKVSLAAFNGYLYMVHTGSEDSAATWLSRFDPATEQWTANYQLPYATFDGPPALASYSGKLYLVGTSGTSPYQMWWATMTTSETFSAATAIPGHQSGSKPAATALNGKLYIVHRYGATGELVWGTFNGATWTGPTYVPGGVNGAPVRALQPAIATDGNFIHLVHRRPEDGSNYVWWTYFDGCKWAAAELSLGSRTSSLEPSLAQSSSGLVMITTSNDDWNWVTESRFLYTTQYARTYNPFPPNLPTCGVVIGGAASAPLLQ